MRPGVHLDLDGAPCTGWMPTPGPSGYRMSSEPPTHPQRVKRGHDASAHPGINREDSMT